jgi:Polyketide cyclase / dehydrase and lipid transport
MAPATYTVERTTTVHAHAPEIYPHIADFHRWTEWSPWEGMDPDLQRDYSGAESGPGAVYTWSGNRKAGQGRMEITGAEEPNRVVIDLRFEKPFKSSSETTFLLEPDGPGTKVTWRMTGPATMMTKVMGLFTSMDKMIGPDFEKGLERLRGVAESQG